MDNQKILLTGLLLIGFIALAESGYGDVCEDDCNLDNAECEVVPRGCGKLGLKRCVCKEDFSWDRIAQRCMCHKEINDKCDPAEDICPIGATCLDGKCQCVAPLKPSEDEEWCGLKYCDECTADSDCSDRRGKMTCQDDGSKKTCQCAPGYEWLKDEKHCAPSGEGVIKCVQDAKCKSHCPNQMSCVQGYCKCLSNEMFDTESRACVPSSAMVGGGIGDHCSFVTVGSEGQKFCAFGLTCFRCAEGSPYNITAGHRCARVPNPNSSGRLYPTLISTLIAVFTSLAFNR